jgi:hypothetical protein
VLAVRAVKTTKLRLVYKHETRFPPLPRIRKHVTNRSLCHYPVSYSAGLRFEISPSAGSANFLQLLQANVAFTFLEHSCHMYE